MFPGTPGRSGRGAARRANRPVSIAVALVALVSALMAKHCAPDLPERPDGAVAVCSWNMEWFPSGWPEPQPRATERRRIAAAAEGLRRGGVPDILMVQEIRDRATCDEFAAALGGDLRTAVCSDFWNNPTNRSLQQVAVLSRLPCVASGFEPWTAADFVYPPRGFAWAVFDAGGRRIACFDVHLKSNYVPEGKDEARQAVLNRLKRELATEQLVRRIEAIAGRYASGRESPAVIVAGDFNTAAEDPRFAGEKTIRTILEAGLRDAFEGIPEAERPTLPASDMYPAATFDHIYSKGLGKPFSRRVGLSIETSDHRPVYAAFVADEPDDNQ